MQAWKAQRPKPENCSVFAVQVKDVEVNFSQMFVNTVEGLEAGGAQLQHVHFVSGTLVSEHLTLGVCCLLLHAATLQCTKRHCVWPPAT